MEVGEYLLLEDLVGHQTKLLTNPGAAEDVRLALGVDGELQQFAETHLLDVAPLGQDGVGQVVCQGEVLVIIGDFKQKI